MKKSILIIVATILMGVAFNFDSYGSEEVNNLQGKKGAVGFMLGSPSGFMARIVTGDRGDALTAGFGLLSGSDIYLFADYNLNIYQYRFINVYAGLGAAFYQYEKGKEESNGIEGRMPVGAEAFIHRASIGAFLEIIPAIRINDPEFNLRGYLGARYYF